MYKHLDFVHVMCYDYHGKWDRKTGHNAPLQPRPDEQSQDLHLNVKYTIDYLIKRGAKPEKTVLGIPLYGRAFSLENPQDFTIGAKSGKIYFCSLYEKSLKFLCRQVKIPSKAHTPERMVFWVTTKSVKSSKNLITDGTSRGIQTTW